MGTVKEKMSPIDLFRVAKFAIGFLSIVEGCLDEIWKNLDNFDKNREQTYSATRQWFVY